MQRDIYWKITEKVNTPEAREATVSYLAEHLGGWLMAQERVLICFLNHEIGSIGWLMEQAVLRCGAEPVVWGPDRRWKTLPRLAFSQRITAIIGPPLVVLGLTKICKYRQTPLFVRKVVTAGYPSLNWMIEGIENGMDCEAGGCFSVDNTGIVAGFACGHSFGVHLREEEFGVEIVDADGGLLPAGIEGEMVLYPQSDPSLRLHLGDCAKKVTERCRCGSSSPRLTQMRPGRSLEPDLLTLGESLQKWTSILDCRLTKGECGLEMEIIYFQGEKLPKLPSAAKLVLKPWDPETDEPFPHDPTIEFLY